MRKLLTRRKLAAAAILIALLLGIYWLRAPRISAAKPLPPGKVRPQLVSAMDSAVLLAPDGSLWEWGEWRMWITATLETRAVSKIPQRIGSESDWTQVGEGVSHIVALKAEGSLWAWGRNDDGSVGQPNLKTNFDAPTRIGSKTNWIKICSGNYHNLALKDDGSLWAWGFNKFGQLGDGTTSNRSVPTMIGADRDWRTIVAGGHNSYAIKSNGTLWGWGAGFPTNIPAPRQIAPGTSWLAVSADDGNLLVAVKTDGTLWLRGRRFQLLATHVDPRSDGDLNQIGKDSDWTEVYAGRDSFFARKKNGSWWVCGENEDGQLGAGGIGAWVPSPKPLRFGFDPWAFAPGDGTTLMLGKDGRLWTWGRRLGTQQSTMAWKLRLWLAPVTRRFPSVDHVSYLFRSDIDRTPFRLWELPADVRNSLGTGPSGPTKNGAAVISSNVVGR